MSDETIRIREYNETIHTALSEIAIQAAEENGAANGARRAAEPLPWPREADAIVQRLAEPTEHRTALMVLLMHAARALAASQITLANGMERIAICATCGEATPADTPARHRATCLAAEVISIVALLCQPGETSEANTEKKGGVFRIRG